jgi:hypothetical protein
MPKKRCNCFDVVENVKLQMASTLTGNGSTPSDVTLTPKKLISAAPKVHFLDLLPRYGDEVFLVLV